MSKKEVFPQILKLAYRKHNPTDFSEVIKLLLVRKILNKYRKNSNWIKIHTEVEYMEGKRCQVYLENVKTKEVFAYKIMRRSTRTWDSRIVKDSKSFKLYNMDAKLIMVDMNGLSKNLKELNEQLDQYIN